MRKFFYTSLFLGLFMLSNTVLAAEWQIDKAHSNVGFKVKHLAITNVSGKFADFSGKIVYDPANPEKLQMDIKIPVSTVDTGNEKRDAHLRSADFFDAEKYEYMTFKSKKTKVLDDDHFQITGNLTIKDKTHEVILDVVDIAGPVNMMGSERIGATATTKIDRFDYGLNFDKKLEAGGLVVGSEVKIILEMELMK